MKIFLLKWINLVVAAVKIALTTPLLILPLWWVCLMITINLPAIMRGWRLTNDATVE